MKKLKILFLVLLCLCKFVDAQKVETLVNDTEKNFEAISWLPDGKIYVADYTNGRLYKITLDGHVETLITEFSNIAGGGLDNNGNFYFSGIANGTLNRLSPSGGFSEVANGFNQPVGVLPITGTNQVFLAVYGENAVYKVDVSNGEKERIAVNGGINGPDGMVYLGEKEFLVANFNNNRIHKVDSAYQVSLFAQLPITGFAGYIARGGDHFYIPSIAGHKIFKINIDGLVSEFAGSGAEGHEDGDLNSASFTSPNGIAMNSSADTMLISDGSHIRIITGLGQTTGQENLTAFGSIQLSPNPCIDHIILSIEGSKEIGGYEIYNAGGSLVKKDELRLEDSSRIDVQELGEGLHSILLFNRDKSASKLLRFIKM